MTTRRNVPEFREMLILYALLLGVGAFWHPQDPLFINVHPHPFWAVILLSAVRYGNPAGILAGLTAALLYMGNLLIEGVSLEEALHLEIFTFLPPTLYILVGSLVGEAMQKRDNINAFLREQLAAEKQRGTESELRRQELHTAYRKLEGRLAGESDSITRFFSFLRQIEAPSLEAIYMNLLRVVRDALDAQVCTLWLRTSHETYVQFGREDANVPLPLLGKIALREERVVTAREFFLDREVEPADGLLAGLLHTRDGQVEAIVIIQQLPFVRFTARTAMLFEILLDWTSQLLAHQNLVQHMQERDILNQNLGLTSEVFFRTNTLKMCRQMQRQDVSSALLMLSFTGELTMVVRHRLNLVMAAILQETLRQSDTAAYFTRATTFAVFLPGTDVENAQRVCDKLEDHWEAFGFQPYMKTDTPLVIDYSIKPIDQHTNLEHLLDMLESTDEEAC